MNVFRVPTIRKTYQPTGSYVEFLNFIDFLYEKDLKGLNDYRIYEGALYVSPNDSFSYNFEHLLTMDILNTSNRSRPTGPRSECRVFDRGPRGELVVSKITHEFLVQQKARSKAPLGYSALPGCIVIDFNIRSLLGNVYTTKFLLQSCRKNTPDRKKIAIGERELVPLNDDGFVDYSRGVWKYDGRSKMGGILDMRVKSKRKMEKNLRRVIRQDPKLETAIYELEKLDTRQDPLP